MYPLMSPVVMRTDHSPLMSSAERGKLIDVHIFNEVDFICMRTSNNLIKQERLSIILSRKYATTDVSIGGMGLKNAKCSKLPENVITSG
ncbi:hypothetical protein ACTXT7_003860 [Hymenolepis weldensis]